MDLHDAYGPAGSNGRPVQAGGVGREAGGWSVNAGHDLDLDNLAAFIAIGGIAEVSIGHAPIADALDIGLAAAVRKYLDAIAAGTAERGV